MEHAGRVRGAGERAAVDRQHALAPALGGGRHQRALAGPALALDDQQHRLVAQRRRARVDQLVGIEPRLGRQQPRQLVELGVELAIAALEVRQEPRRGPDPARHDRRQARAGLVELEQPVEQQRRARRQIAGELRPRPHRVVHQHRQQAPVDVARRRIVGEVAQRDREPGVEVGRDRERQRSALARIEPERADQLDQRQLAVGGERALDAQLDQRGVPEVGVVGLARAEVGGPARRTGELGVGLAEQAVDLRRLPAAEAALALRRRQRLELPAPPGLVLDAQPDPPQLVAQVLLGAVVDPDLPGIDGGRQVALLDRRHRYR